MKQMILTGMATEQQFGKPDPQFYLVFNEGELRVPISPKAAEEVVQAMYNTENVSQSVAPESDHDEDVLHDDGDSYDSESDIPQA